MIERLLDFFQSGDLYCFLWNESVNSKEEINGDNGEFERVT